MEVAYDNTIIKVIVVGMMDLEETDLHIMKVIVVRQDNSMALVVATMGIVVVFVSLWEF